MSSMPTRCPFCNSICPPIIAQDGGSRLCSRCGVWHNCANGPVLGSPGPSLCPLCNPPSQPKPTASSPSKEVCPWCGDDRLQFLYDGGSIECPRDGRYHHCVNGPVRGGPGPLDCQACRQARTPQRSAQPPSVQPVPIESSCDGCGAGIQAVSGARFKCMNCDNFDFCHNCVQTKQHNNLHRFQDFYRERNLISGQSLLTRFV